MNKQAAVRVGNAVRDVLPIRNLVFVVDPGGDSAKRRFWQPPEQKFESAVIAGQRMAQQFASEAKDPSIAMLLPQMVEEMTGAPRGTLLRTQAGAFLVELARLASTG